MAQDRIWIILVIGASVIAAIIEALAASMIAPLIASQSNSASFSNTPFLGTITALFDNYEVNEKLEIIALVLFILFVLRGISQYTVQAINTIAPVIMRRRLVLTGYSSVLNAELTHTNQRSIGDHTVNLDSHPSWISNALVQLAHIVTQSLIFLVYLCLMLAVSWKMTVFALFFLIVMTYGIRTGVSKHLKNLSAKLSTTKSKLDQIIFETLHGIDVSSDGERIYVSGRKDGNLHIFNGGTGKLERSISLGNNPLAGGVQVFSSP